MLKFKTAYIPGLLVATAIFGLSACKTGSNSPPVPVTPQSVTGSGYVDPTLVQTTDTSTLELDGYDALFSNGKAIFTGANFSDKLQYTDANDDAGKSLMSQLRKELTNEAAGDDSAQQANLDFAKDLNLTQVVLNPNDPGTEPVQVNFQLKRGGATIDYSFEGRVDIKLGKYNPVVDVDLRPVTGPRDMVVSMTCLDAGNSCHNSLITFNDKSEPQVRKAFAVFRTGDVKLQFYGQGADNQFTTSPYNSLLKILRNSVKHGNHPQKLPFVQNTILESATVVNGRSNFALFSRIQHDNGAATILPIFGSLLRPQGQDNQVEQALPDPHQTVLKDSSASPYDSVMAGISEYRLIQNDGRGTIQILLDFGADQQLSDLVILTVSRSQVQLRALNQ